MKFFLKICLYSFVSFFLWLGFLNIAKAEITLDSQINTTDNLVSSGWTNTTGYTYTKSIDFTGCENPLIIENADEYTGVRYSVYFDDVEFTRTGLSSAFDAYTERYFVINHIIPSSDSGTLKIVNTGPSDNGQHNFLIFCGVDPTTPIIENAFRYQLNSSGWTNGTQYDFTEIDSGNLHLALSFSRYYSNYSGYDYYFNPTTDFTEIYDVGRGGVLRLTASTATGDDEFVIPYNNGYSPDTANFYLTLNEAVALPSISGTVYWSGVGTQYGTIGKNVSIPFYFNVCSDYSDIRQVYAYLDWGEGLGYMPLIEDKTIFIGAQQCSGLRYLDIPFGYLTENSVASSSIVLQVADFATSSEYILINSSPFNYHITVASTPVNYFESGVISPLNVSTGTGTTTLAFNYNFVGMDLIDPEVCLYNSVSGRIVDIVACASVSTTTSSYGLLSIPNVSNYSFTGNFVLLTNDQIAFGTKSFQINFTGALPYNDQFEQDLENATNTDMALANTFFSVGGDFLKGIFNPILFSLKQVFPFNVPVIIYSAWFDSVDLGIPSSQTVFSPLSSNGDLTVNLPSRFMGTASTSVVVFGGSLLTSDNNASAWYSGIRVFSTTLLWFLFVSLFVFVAYKTFNLISGNRDTAFENSGLAFNKSNGRPTSITYSVKSKRGKGSKSYHKYFG